MVVKVDCTLTELFNGCQKKLTYAKNVLTEDGLGTKSIMESKNIEILPGISKDTPLIFLEQGNQEPGYRSSRLIFDIV